MDETLRIKLTVDTSEIKSSIAQTKQTLASVGNGSQQTTQATKQTEASIQSLKDTMAQVRNMSMFDLILEGLDKMRGSFRKAKAEIHGLGGAFDMFRNMKLSFGSSENFTKNTEFFDASFSNRLKHSINSMTLGFQGIGKSFKELGAGIKAAMGTFSSLLAILALVVAAIAAIVALTKSAINTAKKIRELNIEANKVNMTIQAYQEWGYVLKQCGIEVESLTNFVKKLAEKQKEVVSGSEESISAFKELGLSASEVAGMGQEELFNETITRLQQVEDTTKRTALAYRIFTDDAVNLNAVLHLSNAETQSLINSYYALGAAPTETLIERSNTLSATTTNLSYAWQGLKNTFSEIVLPVIIKVVEWITIAIMAVNAFLKTIFGIELVGKKTSTSLDKGSSGFKGITSGIKGATAAAKEFLRYTMGFDELNVIPDNKASSGGSSGGSGSGISAGGIGGGFSAELPEFKTPDISGIMEWLGKFKNIIQDVLTFSLMGIGIVYALIMLFGGPACFSGVIAGLALAGVGFAIGNVEGSTFDRYGEKIKPLVDSVIKWFKDTVETIKEFCKNLKERFGEIIKWIDEKFIQPFVNFFKDAWAKIKEFFAPAVKWFSELFGSISATVKSVVEVIKGLFKGAWDGIKIIWGVVVSWFNENIVVPLKTKFTEIWTTVKTKAKEAWEGIKAVFSPVVEWFKEKFSAAWKKVKEVFSAAGEIFQGIKEAISSVFKTVVNHIIDGLNRVIAIPFNKINNMLNKIREVEVAGFQPFKPYIKYNAVSVPQIPKLAKGGIAVSSVLANIGEAGKEAVLPLEHNTGWMDILADKIASRNSSPSRIVLMVGERELGYATINSINGITEQTGSLQLKLV